MSNLPNNTTLDGGKIISEADKNNHRHDSSQIQGLSENAVGDVFVYAERIDGYTYSNFQNTFISANNNTMTGVLNVSNNSISQNNIINVSELDSLKISNNIDSYSISDIPPVEEVNTSTRSIMVTGSIEYLDLSWTPTSVSNSNSSLSIYRPSGNQYTRSKVTNPFQITNYSSFDDYTVSTNIGTISLDTSTGLVSHTAPDTAPTQETVTINITNVTQGSSKDITLTLLEDPEIILEYSYDGVTYNSISSAGIDINSENDFYLLLTNYNSDYTYSLTTDITGLTYSITDDVITVTPPFQNETPSTGTITVSRQGSQYTVDINLNEYNMQPDWVVSTTRAGFSGTSNALYAGTKLLNGDFVGAGNYRTTSTSASLVMFDENLESTTTTRIAADTESTYFYAITATSDGGGVAAGYYIPDDGSFNRNAFIVKFDSNLNSLIYKELNDQGTASRFTDVIELSGGGFVAISNPIDAATIYKLDANLNIVAQRSITLNGGLDDISLNSVIELSNGDIVTAGFLYKEAETGYDGYIAKFNSNLQSMIQKECFGGIHDIIEMSNGNIAACGSTVDTGTNSTQANIHILDTSLSPIAQKFYIGSNQTEVFRSIKQKDDGGFIISGDTIITSPDRDLLLLDIDNNLDIVSEKALAGDTDYLYFGYDIIVSSPERYIVVSRFDDNVNFESCGLLASIPSDFSLLTGSLTDPDDNGQWTTLSYTYGNAAISILDITPSITTTTYTLDDIVPVVDSASDLTFTRNESA